VLLWNDVLEGKLRAIRLAGCFSLLAIHVRDLCRLLGCSQQPL
jgi:hypothetical protein